LTDLLIWRELSFLLQGRLPRPWFVTVRIGRSQRVIGYREGDACYCAWIGLPPGVEQRRMKCARP
jgi:hypothetical protein